MSRSRTLATRDLARIAVFAAFIAVLGLPGTLQPFGNSVPITAQTLGVMLAGCLIGARLGFFAVGTFLILVAAGLPLLAGGRGGLGVFSGPSAGYLIGWLLGVVAIGWIAHRTAPRFPVPIVAAANAIGGIIVIYAVGIPVQAAVTGTSSLIATLTASAVYLPGDLIKVVIATAVTVGVHKAYPASLGARTSSVR